MAGQSAGKTNYTEKNNHKQGRSGSGIMKKPGPAKGKRGIVNPTKSGGIFRPTKSNQLRLITIYYARWGGGNLPHRFKDNDMDFDLKIIKDNLSYKEADKALMDGFKIARKNWNGNMRNWYLKNTHFTNIFLPSENKWYRFMKIFCFGGDAPFDGEHIFNASLNCEADDWYTFEFKEI